MSKSFFGPPFCRAEALNFGMIATGNHVYFDSLRGAPLRRPGMIFAQVIPMHFLSSMQKTNIAIKSVRRRGHDPALRRRMEFARETILVVIGFRQQARQNKQRNDMSFRAERSEVEESTHYDSICSEIGAKILRLAIGSLRMTSP